MRSLLIVCLVACVALTAGMANAAGQISDNALAQMGLSGLQTMSDTQGTQVRGMGFAAVCGSSWTSVSVVTGPVTVSWGSSNQYAAESKHLAAGGSVSTAVIGAGVFRPCGNTGVVVGVLAGGAAVAYAK